MKNKNIKKLVVLFTLVCLMLNSFVLPLQAATSNTAASNTAASNTATYTWTENTSMRTYTSTHFESMVVTAIATVLANRFGGVYANYLAAATSLVGSSVIQETQNSWMVIYFYWQPSDIPEVPYYILKHIEYFSDPGYSNYVTSSNRYYYSYTPY